MADLIPLAKIELAAANFDDSEHAADVLALCHAVRCLDDLLKYTPAPRPDPHTCDGHPCDICGRRRRAREALARFDLAEPEAQKDARRAS